jgi:5-methylcytosine-specific restriction protein B
MERANLVRFCTFHPSYGYEHFLEGLRPKTVNGRMVFEPEAGIFKDLCRDAQDDEEQRSYFLIIDEINRGDVPRIFGELLTALEQDKRNRPVVLPVTKTPFRIPPNVFLIGTMNTADRSISLLDAALRRRFGFVELMPDSSVLKGKKVAHLPLGPWLDALNERLRRHLKRDARNLQIGHSYLLGLSPVSSVSDFARVLRDELIPLLEEYCYEDFAVLKDILGPAFVDVEEARIKAELFDPNREDDLLQAAFFEELELRTLAEGAVDEAEAPGTGGDEESDAGSQ